MSVNKQRPADGQVFLSIDKYKKIKYTKNQRCAVTTERCNAGAFKPTSLFYFTSFKKTFIYFKVPIFAPTTLWIRTPSGKATG